MLEKIFINKFNKSFIWWAWTWRKKGWIRRRIKNRFRKKYQKIGILTDLNNITESEAQIKYIDKVKYYNDYKLIKTLGAGSICKVKLVEKDNVKYALKIVNKNILSKKKKFEQDENGKMVITTPMEGILKEIAILKKSIIET